MRLPWCWKVNFVFVVASVQYQNDELLKPTLFLQLPLYRQQRQWELISSGISHVISSETERNGGNLVSNITHHVNSNWSMISNWFFGFTTEQSTLLRGSSYNSILLSVLFTWKPLTHDKLMQEMFVWCKWTFDKTLLRRWNYPLFFSFLFKSDISALGTFYLQLRSHYK